MLKDILYTIFMYVQNYYFNCYCFMQVFFLDMKKMKTSMEIYVMKI